MLRTTAKGSFLVLSLVLPVALALVASPAEASQDCQVDFQPADCEYPPYYHGSTPDVLIATGGLDDGRAWNPATDLATDALHRVTISRPGFYETWDESEQSMMPMASCNDGSPAVMYVRGATNLESEDKWLIVLEGGGAGFDGSPTGTLDSGMWSRWTGEASNNPSLDWAAKTSTDWQDAGSGGFGQDGILDIASRLYLGGIFDSTNSAFGDWNWVFINYCSSDLWTGQARGLPLPNASSWADATTGETVTGFKMDFTGHITIEAVLEMLKQNIAWTSDKAPYATLPDIDNADTVLFAGESAGGGGVRYNLDFVADTLTTTNANVDVYGSTGASLRPEAGDITNPWTVDNLEPFGVDDVVTRSEEQYSQIQQMSGFIDQSCETNYGDWTCTMTYTMGIWDEWSTPIMVKMDLTDNQVVTGPSALFAGGIREAFDDFDTTVNMPAYFGPNCGGHETLTSGNHYTHRLEKFQWDPILGVGASLGQFMSYNDALEGFVGGNDPRAYAGKFGGIGANQFIWLAAC